MLKFAQSAEYTQKNEVKSLPVTHVMVERSFSSLHYTGSPIFKRRNFTELQRTSNKEKQCNFFCKFAFFLQIFLQYFAIFLILMCVSKYVVSYTITRFYTNFFINDPHSKKHDPKVIEKNFDNKKDVHILSKYNKEEIIKIHHRSPEIFKFL